MVGIFSWYGIPQTFIQRIKSIKNAGFDATSIWIDEDNRREIGLEDEPNIIRDYGLIIEYAHAPYRNINSLWDKYKSQEIELEIKTHIDYCAKNEIPILVIHLTKGYRIKEANEYGLIVLRRLIEYAKDRKIRIAAENTKQDNVLEKVFNEIEDPVLGLCFDTSHDNLYGDIKFEIMEKYRKRLLCLHISDNDGHVDDHWIPYQGKIDWEAFIHRFPREYGGILNLEILPKGKNADGDSLLAEAYRVIKKIEFDIHAKI